MSLQFLIPMPARYHAEVASARALDKLAREQYGQRDADHHLCCLQNQHLREGMLMYEIYRTIYGYQFGDTHNDGRGRLLHRGATLAEAIAYAREWHAQDPEKRGVILGHGTEAP
jgi:hypothetical protein